MSGLVSIEFIPSGRGKAQCPPDPRYPHGITIPYNAPHKCLVELPYPAPECGVWRVECLTCGYSMLITAAGRADDPISVEVPCIDERQTQ